MKETTDGRDRITDWIDAVVLAILYSFAARESSAATVGVLSIFAGLFKPWRAAAVPAPTIPELRPQKS